MENIKLAAIKRDATKGAVRKLRNKGYIPAVVYGGSDNINVAVSAQEFNNKFHTVSENHIVELNIDGEVVNVLIKEFQKDWMRSKMIHIDFLRVIKGHEIKTHIPLKIVGAGSTPGEKAGGLLEIYLHEVEIICLPRHLPSEIQVDISALNVGEAFSVGNLVLPDGIRVVTSQDQTIAVIEHARDASVAKAEAEVAEVSN